MVDFGLQQTLPWCAPIAQLDRASDYESEGRKFKSCWAHHLSLDLLSNLSMPAASGTSIVPSRYGSKIPRAARGGFSSLRGALR